MKYVLGIIAGLVGYFFWFEPLFINNGEESHPRMALYNASQTNEVIKAMSEQAKQDLAKGKESGKNFIATLKDKDFSDPDVQKALYQATKQLCENPAFSQRFELSTEQCIERTMAYYKKCENSLLDDMMTIMLNPDAVIENGVGALKCQA